MKWDDIQKISGLTTSVTPHGMKIIKVGKHLEVRLNSDDTLDEIVTYDVDGKCDFHLEQMGDDLFWMRVYGTTAQPLEQEVAVNLVAKKREIVALWELEEAFEK